MEERDFRWALDKLKEGKRVMRSSWAKSKQWIKIRWPLNYSEQDVVDYPKGEPPMTRPYLFIELRPGRYVPWTPNQDDLFATDWAEPHEVELNDPEE